MSLLACKQRVQRQYVCLPFGIAVPGTGPNWQWSPGMFLQKHLSYINFQQSPGPLFEVSACTRGRHLPSWFSLSSQVGWGQSSWHLSDPRRVEGQCGHGELVSFHHPCLSLPASAEFSLFAVHLLQGLTNSHESSSTEHLCGCWSATTLMLRGGWGGAPGPESGTPHPSGPSCFLLQGMLAALLPVLATTMLPSPHFSILHLPLSFARPLKPQPPPSWPFLTWSSFTVSSSHFQHIELLVPQGLY